MVPVTPEYTEAQFRDDVLRAMTVILTAIIRRYGLGVAVEFVSRWLERRGAVVVNRTADGKSSTPAQPFSG